MATQKTLAEMVWDDLTQQIAAINTRLDTLQARTERSETASGHASATLATAPTAAQGAKAGDELWLTDQNALAYYNDTRAGWYINLPRRVTLFHEDSIVLSGTALARVINTAQLYNHYAHQNPAANGDSFTQSFLLLAGQYTFRVLGMTSTDFGILDWYLDDTLMISQQDFYSVAGANNVVFNATVTVPTSGPHTLRAVVNGKNTSSSNFFIRLTKFAFIPTGGD